MSREDLFDLVNIAEGADIGNAYSHRGHPHPLLLDSRDVPLRPALVERSLDQLLHGTVVETATVPLLHLSVDIFGIGLVVTVPQYVSIGMKTWAAASRSWVSDEW